MRPDDLAEGLGRRRGEDLVEAVEVGDQHPEGLFFPDTYLFDKGTADLDILRRARERMQIELAAAWEDRADDLPISTPYQALILASIVEK